MEQDTIFQWLEVLDALDYYELLGAPRGATSDEVRAAFHVFAETFHPDAHAARGDRERAALDTIFKRGSEAYENLADPIARAQYDARLEKAEDDPRGGAPPRVHTVPPSGGSGRPTQPPKLEDHVRSPSARPFARRAEELVQKGDLKQARLQMVMAKHHDPGNDALADYLHDIEEQLMMKK